MQTFNQFFCRPKQLGLAIVLTLVLIAAISIAANANPPPPRGGAYLYTGLIQASNGNFYGTTYSGGYPSGDGTVFKMDTAGNVTLLHAFSGYNASNPSASDGASPYASLVQGSDGKLYGSTWVGGQYNDGTIFRIDPTNNSYQILHSCTATGAANPQAALIQGSDGYFYGTGSGGGVNGTGSVFKMDTAGNVTILYSFGPFFGGDGSAPSSALVQGRDGYFYGSTFSGGQDNFDGTVFRISSTGAYTKLHSFNFTDGANPEAPLIQGTDGYFYGTTSYGGPNGVNGDGTAFKMDTAGNITTLYDFTDTNSNPFAGLIQVGNLFYGTTSGGGANSNGAVFQLDSTGHYTALHLFNGADGSYPSASLIKGQDGKLYGTAQIGGVAYGTAFKIDTAGNFTLLHIWSDGAAPFAGLIQANDGNFYGTTQYGGEFDYGNLSIGTAFKMDTSGNVVVLHSFICNTYAPYGLSTDGANPLADLIQASDGKFYGTTQNGGNYGYGTVFKIDTSGNVTILHSFNNNGTDGLYPNAALIQGSDGNFYGTTPSGGNPGGAGVGTIFKMDTSGNITILHAFKSDGSEGDSPSGLIQASDGNLYGVASSGGTMGYGTVFRISASGTNFTVLHNFNPGTDGGIPGAALCEDSQHPGNFYGSASGYGPTTVSDPVGTIFKITSTGSFTVLHTFNGNSTTDGADPAAQLVQGSNGLFYGTTVGIESNPGSGTEYGNVFSIDSSGNFHVLHVFNNSDGSWPTGKLLKGTDGFYYGTTRYGGTFLGGTTFKIDPSTGNLTTLHSFSGITH